LGSEKTATLSEEAIKRVHLITIDPKGSNSQRILGSEAQSASCGLKDSSRGGNLGKKERSICREGDSPWERQKLRTER